MRVPSIRAALIGLLLAALVVRVGWVLTLPAEVDQRLPDQYEYLSVARNVLAGHGFIQFDERFGQHVQAFRTPGYPLFLAGMGGSVLAARLIQVLIDTSIVLAGFLLARRWLSPWGAWAAAAVIAVNPFLIYFSGTLLSETLFTGLLVWGMVLLAGRANFFWGAVVLALAVLVRPSALVLPVLLSVLAAIMHGRTDARQRWWQRLPVATTALLLTVLMLLPWAVRNRMVLGEWIWTTTNGGITRYDGFRPGATGASDQRFAVEPEMRHVRLMDEVERDRYFNREADRWIGHRLEHDRRGLIQLTAAKIGRTWSPIPLSDEFGRNTLRVIVAAVYTVPFFLLAAVGLLRSRLQLSAKAFLLAPALYFTFIHAISVGSLRYRIPAEPPLAVLAAAGLLVLIAAIARPAWRRSAAEE